MKVDTVQADPTVLNQYFAEMSAIPVLSADQEMAAIRKIEEMEGNLLLDILRQKWFSKGAVHKLLDSMAAEDIPISSVKSAMGAKSGKDLIRAIKFHDPGRQWLDSLYGRLTKGSFPEATAESKRWVRTARHKFAEISLAKNQFASANLRLVILIAKKYRRPGSSIALADLIQEGNLGLMKAVDRFDVERGFKFSTYSLWWIRHYIKRSIDDREGLVRLPVHLTDNIRKIARARAVYQARTGESMSEEQAAEATGLTQAKVRAVHSYMIRDVTSLQAPVVASGDVDIEDLLEADVPRPDDELFHSRLKEEIKRVLTALTPMESQIVRWRLGLDGCDELTLQEIANKYDLSRERIRQIEARAFEKMRHRSSLKEYR